jgi:hypothetical protein
MWYKNSYLIHDTLWRPQETKTITDPMDASQPRTKKKKKEKEKEKS